MVQQHFVVDIIKARTRRDFDVGIAAQFQNSMDVRECSFMIVDVFQHVEAHMTASTLAAGSGHCRKSNCSSGIRFSRCASFCNEDAM